LFWVNLALWCHGRTQCGRWLRRRGTFLRLRLGAHGRRLWGCGDGDSCSSWGWIDLASSRCFLGSLLRLCLGWTSTLLLVGVLMGRHHRGGVCRTSRLDVFARVGLRRARLEETTYRWSAFLVRAFSRAFGSGIHDRVRACRDGWATIVMPYIGRGKVLECDLTRAKRTSCDLENQVSIWATGRQDGRKLTWWERRVGPSGFYLRLAKKRKQGLGGDW
jgi:hypothetical protein